MQYSRKAGPELYSTTYLHKVHIPGKQFKVVLRMYNIQATLYQLKRYAILKHTSTRMVFSYQLEIYFFRKFHHELCA
jgi:hypothetical protein